MMRIPGLLLAAMMLATACAEQTADAPAEREGFITTDDGVRLYYVEKGAGAETLVVPVALYLEDLLEPLADGRRVIFYDPRHRGRSGAGDLANVSLDRQIADLEALREGLGIEKMAVLGWSGLGMEMAVYTLRHPERVTRLVQMSAVPPYAAMMSELGDGRQRSIDADALAALNARQAAGEFEEAPDEYCRLMNALINPTNFVDASYVDQVPDVCVHENEWPVNLWPYFGALLPSFGDYDWRDDMKSLSLPRLVIHGREDGIPVEGGYAWAAGYDNTRLLVVSPAGHFPFVEQREQVLSAIDTFLDGEWPEGAEVVPAAE